MREAFQGELKETEQRLVRLAQLVEQAIMAGTAAFLNSDLTRAESVVSQDQEIDKRSSQLNEFVVDVLVRQQPVASDMRLMVASLRIASHLERMGDLAEHIAMFARYRYPHSVLPPSLEKPFIKMGQLDVQVAGNLVKLLETQELEFAARIRELDDEIDALHAGVFDAVLDAGFDGDATTVVDATLSSRYHERFGDHAVSITDQVLYLISGEHVGDQQIWRLNK